MTLSTDAKVLLVKMFGGPGLPEKQFICKKNFSLRAIEASCELIEAGYITYTQGSWERTYYLKKAPHILVDKQDVLSFDIFEHEQPKCTPIISALKVTGVLQNKLIGCLQTGDQSNYHAYIEQAVSELQALLR